MIDWLTVFNCTRFLKIITKSKFYFILFELIKFYSILRDEPVEVSGEKFYQVDEEYFTSTKKDASKDKEEPFSLLKLLNRGRWSFNA